jgi:hypothetical protein
VERAKAGLPSEDACLPFFFFFELLQTNGGLYGEAKQSVSFEESGGKQRSAVTTWVLHVALQI